MDVSKEEAQKAGQLLGRRLYRKDLELQLQRYVPFGLRNGVLTNTEKATLLAEIRGSELLRDRDLRISLVRGDPALASSLVERSTEDFADVEDVAIRVWHSGKNRARHFCQALGLPMVFARAEVLNRPESFLALSPVTPLPPLVDFQEDVANQIIDILERRIDPPIGLMSLPTGAGKTRTAMTAIVRYQDEHPDAVIVWLATTQEVCEQAVQSYLRIRSSNPPSVPVQLQRFWADHELDARFQSGLIFASVQKMYRRLEEDDIPHQILQNISAVFFDEAHHSIAPTFNATLDYLDHNSTKTPISIIGLTATPGRGSDPLSQASRRLVQYYASHLIRPRLSNWENPIQVLQERGILAIEDPYVIQTNRPFEMDQRTREFWEEFHDFSPSFLGKVAADEARNQIILDQITKLGGDRQGIIYTCSVEHARHLAILLNRVGLPSYAISAETRPSLRHNAIMDFLAGRLRFLTNFGVLTTGFDAPAVSLIVLARPISSQVLYEQMLGRGLRGPVFGGTEECRILDFEDSIRTHGQPLAYRRFLWLWDRPMNGHFSQHEMYESMGSTTDG